MLILPVFVLFLEIVIMLWLNLLKVDVTCEMTCMIFGLEKPLFFFFWMVDELNLQPATL